MPKIQIEATLEDDEFDEEGKLTSEAYDRILDAVMYVGDDVQITEIPE